MSAQNNVKPSADAIAASVKAAAKGRGLPPVDKWDPPDRGKIDMKITRDGIWFHEGTPINRPELVRLFSTILRRDDDRYMLVTPVEKVEIEVEDAPFLAVDFEVAGTGEAQALTFHTTVGDQATAGPDNPIRVVRDAETGEPSPYVTIRRRLEALIDRKSFYRLIDLGVHREHEGASWFGLWSQGSFFPIIPSDELTTD
ncbi:DUF1285 domain-containing protein [Pseudooceanicola sp. MF1-13]|uniref:DUF1285 domain-containing protein n=1 Tax=Pseudooceanicola sp. MF1-13 TaxID=3379095 RepID=UPI00389283B6